MPRTPAQSAGLAARDVLLMPGSAHVGAVPFLRAHEARRNFDEATKIRSNKWFKNGLPGDPREAAPKGVLTGPKGRQGAEAPCLRRSTQLRNDVLVTRPRADSEARRRSVVTEDVRVP